MKASQLKAIAKQRIAANMGTLVGASLIYFAILFVVYFLMMFVFITHLLSQGAFASEEALTAYIDNMLNSSFLNSLITDIITIAVGAVLQTLSVGLAYMCLNTARLKPAKISDLFYVYKRNPDRVILIALIQSGVSYLCMLIPNIMARSSSFGEHTGFMLFYYLFYVAGTLLQMLANILLSQSYFIYIDNPDESVLTYIRVSIKIMKNNIWRYFCLCVSFIGWILVSVISCGIAMLFVMPFIQLTFALFYMQLKDELGSTVDVTIQ